MGLLDNKTVCPRCGEYINHGIKGKLIGAPFRICPHCDKLYYDKAFTEPALATYAEKDVKFNWMKAVYAALPTAVSILYLNSYLKGENSFAIVPGIAFAAIGVLFIVVLIAEIVKVAGKHEREQKIIDLFEDRRGELSEELKDSMSRLADPKYIDALEYYGVNVPDYFHERAERLSAEKADDPAEQPEEQPEE